ncbi:hypothetical protein CRE_23130 [Caenorhabditis remanei]|uniref:Protein kinase domain-containing protein n=1 Tax=Caenorhabditis remanei TaxID=31234 RepID=E3ND33_CAERE|nr:hypothetical protein CRE_23130 [Caenorhabditis remanei]
MTNRIECCPVDIALVSEQVVASVTSDSLTLFSTECSTVLETYRANSIVNVYADEDHIHMIGAKPLVYTVDVENSAVESKEISSLAMICCSDFLREENKLLLCSEDLSNKVVLLYDVNTHSVVNKFKTDREVTSVKFRSKNFEVMTAGKNGIWKIYDIRGSSQNPVSTQYDLGGQLRLQGHTGSVSYCLSHVNGANSLYTWKGQGRPQKRWEYSDREWFVGLLPGDNPDDTFAVHGFFKNAQAIITSTKNLPAHKTKYFHKYGTKDESGHFCMNELNKKTFVTACKTGIVVQSAEFSVPDYAKHTARLKDAVRKQKKRMFEDVEHKEMEKVRIRWETEAKKNEGLNVFDTHLSEESFEIGGTLGAGSFGVVFKATSKKTGKDFALKVMPNRCSVYTEKFVTERELLIQREVSHKNIVPMYAAFQTKLSVFFVYEIMNESLQDVLNKKKPMLLAVNESAWLTECVASGLCYIHKRGVLHRDLKHGTVCGSPGYIAPEVISRQKQTPALDCFSLGVILHRSCVGRTPFELPDGHVSDEYVTKCKYSPPVSMNLSVREVTTNLIKKSPSERWTAKQVLYSQLVTDFQHQREYNLQKLVRDNELLSSKDLNTCLNLPLTE